MRTKSHADLENEENVSSNDLVSSQSVAEVWAGAITPASGFVALPMALLRLQSNLRLSATDFVVLANLLEGGRWRIPAHHDDCKKDGGSSAHSSAFR
jgi:hypothetical protein